MYFKSNGFDFYRHNLRLGIKRIICGLSYIRFLEYPLVYNGLNVRQDMKILDVGCGEGLFSSFLASKKCFFVYSIDIRKKEIDRTQECLKKLGLSYLIEAKRFEAEIGNATKLKYNNHFFERVVAISTLEHIQNKGDIIAAKEIGRVLKKGGIVVISVPYSNKYNEIKLNQENNNYFERHYDQKALLERLIKPSGLKISKIIYFREKYFSFFNFQNNENVIPTKLKLAFGWLNPLFSLTNLKTETDANKIKSGGCVIILRKHKPSYKK